MSLHDKQIKSLKYVARTKKSEPEKKDPKKKNPTKYNAYSDGNHLYLFVTEKNQKWWRFKYRHNRRGWLLSLGTYPAVSLSEARAKAHEYNLMLQKGVNPSEERKKEKREQRAAELNTFEAIARDWWAKKTTDKAESTRKLILSRLEKDVFLKIGKMPIDDLRPSDFIAIARLLEARGVRETTHRIIGYCGKIMLYAISGDKRTKPDPIPAVKEQLVPLPKPQHRAATTEPKEVGKILRMIDSYKGTLVVECALKLAPLVFVRPGELRKAEWKDIDLKNKEWRFFVTKTKTDFIVPLSSQAIEILNKLYPATGNSKYLFTNPRSPERPMSENAILAALRQMGIPKEEMSGHGWRAVARTLLDEELKYSLRIIEMQLAHKVRDVHGTAYNRTKFIEERHEMMQAWADYLDKLKSTNPR